MKLSCLTANIKYSLILFFFFLKILSAQQNYSTSGGDILKNGNIWHGRGANCITPGGSLPVTIYTDLKADLVRIPIDVNKSIHTNSELNGYVDQARKYDAAVILCPFWYDNKDLGGSINWDAAQLLGNNPSSDERYEIVKNRMREIATLFKDEMDVFLELWNEPYYWDNSHGYSDSLWESDARDMIENIRSTGAKNITVVQGNATGQGITTILNKGQNLINDYSNIVFDVHMYENGWELSTSAIEKKIKQVRDIGPMIIGEMAAGNHFQQKNNWDEIIEAARNTQTSLTYWLYGKEWSDREEAIKDFVRNKDAESAVRSNHHKLDSADMDQSFNKLAVFPNPFNPITTISFELSEQSHLQIAVYNIKGQIVQILYDDNMQAGLHSFHWNASHLPSGIYFIKMTNRKMVTIQKCILTE